jgi:hypothetical protein
MLSQVLPSSIGFFGIGDVPRHCQQFGSLQRLKPNLQLKCYKHVIERKCQKQTMSISHNLKGNFRNTQCRSLTIWKEMSEAHNVDLSQSERKFQKHTMSMSHNLKGNVRNTQCRSLTIFCLCWECRSNGWPLASVDSSGLVPLEHTRLRLRLNHEDVITLARGQPPHHRQNEIIEKQGKDKCNQ